MDKQERLEKYKLAKEDTESLLMPFYNAKKNEWSAKSVATLLASLFSMAEERCWFENTPDKSKVGESILFHVASLCDDVWSKDDGWNILRLKYLNLGKWELPILFQRELPVSKSLRGPSQGLKVRSSQRSFIERLDEVDPSCRAKNRIAWDELAKQIEYLQDESWTAVFEHEPYSTAIFRFKKSLFRDHLRFSTRSWIDHVKLCELVLAPIYFSAIYEVRSLLQEREKPGVITDQFGQELPLTTHEPFDRCLFCSTPILSKNRRAGAKSCNDGCKSDYHNRAKRAAKF